MTVEAPELKQQLDLAKQDYQEREYQRLASRHKPKATVFRNAVLAFLVGGAICVIAQGFISLYQVAGLSFKDAGTAGVITMIFLGALLTGLGVYDTIAKYGGAGAIIPITGFANSVVSPAMEFKREGFVFGVGARMFNIAGPVLVYGFLISVIIGLIAYILG